MKAIVALVGIFFGIADLVGIIVGFTVSFGTGVLALLIPPYGLYLGVRAILHV